MQLIIKLKALITKVTFVIFFMIDLLLNDRFICYHEVEEVFKGKGYSLALIKMIIRFIKAIIKFVIAVTNWIISLLSFPFCFFFFMYSLPFHNYIISNHFAIVK